LENWQFLQSEISFRSDISFDERPVASRVACGSEIVDLPSTIKALYFNKLGSHRHGFRFLA